MANSPVSRCSWLCCVQEPDAEATPCCKRSVLYSPRHTRLLWAPRSMKLCHFPCQPCHHQRGGCC
ncbi:uncharacterized protein BKA55DRAFT_565929 [Fusarium redolens]|uniref:Uncharacterized protein n=1 Tax=Fusarium redolens TaxID=48865 RepID=A0A9P9HAG5_FUSRE|nr:uncharacterized protein BKA55DRAFT_565929 [Fusarium redolens]KAH7253565.1 hypothetical protein BKA55DRAFT_565929 [Fusarium redolens]